MIISASRRTDIPAYYSDWFMNRIKEGYLYVRNPMNYHQVSEITLSRDVVDCIVFWTKNPTPMLDKLDELKDYPFYFQFTLTGYGKDVEAHLPDKKKVLIPAFQELASKIGPERVILRYDPIIFNERYTPEYHLQAVSQITESLKGYTNKCVISFVDVYRKNQKNLEMLNYTEMSVENLTDFCKELATIANGNGMQVATCSEFIDLEAAGIEHNACIDRRLVERIIGAPLKVARDKNQRNECQCVESIDIGLYNTCKNGCKYCYANFSESMLRENMKKYDVNSPLLCGIIDEQDKITKRAMKSLVESQIKLDL